MLFSVDVRRGTQDLASLMLKMREWLDTQRFEPDTFRHTTDREGVTVHVQFKIEGEANAFARVFAGRRL